MLLLDGFTMVEISFFSWGAYSKVFHGSLRAKTLCLLLDIARVQDRSTSFPRNL